MNVYKLKLFMLEKSLVVTSAYANILVISAFIYSICFKDIKITIATLAVLERAVVI